MLRYGEPQVAIGIVFLVLALLIAALFVTVALQTASDVPFERVQSVGYWLRKRWLGLLCALLVVVVGISLFNLPYARGGGARRTVVHVTGLQFAWIINPSQLPLNAPIRFEVASRDVNHGFAIYDPHGHMVGSVQAMPGYTNKLDLTLHTPGLYTVRCFELCGLNHHLMQSSFTVR
jgi:cytochrome c oxidase subunit II